MRPFVSIVIIFYLTACATQHPPAMEGRERLYAVSLNMAFNTTLQAFQAAGYQIIHSDIATGFISAKSPTRSQSRYTPVSGFGQEFHTLAVTSHIKQAGKNTSRIEIRFLSINQDSSLYGTARHYAPVQNDSLYEDIFGKIELKLPNKPVL